MLDACLLFDFSTLTMFSLGATPPSIEQFLSRPKNNIELMKSMSANQVIVYGNL